MNFSLKDNAGKTKNLVVTTAHGKVKTAHAGSSYRLDALLKLAETGSLTEEELTDSPACATMTQGEAVEILTHMVSHTSAFLTIVPDAKA